MSHQPIMASLATREPQHPHAPALDDVRSRSGSVRARPRRCTTSHRAIGAAPPRVGVREGGEGASAQPVKLLAQQLHLTPQAEVALRRGRGSTTAGLRQKHSKATPYLKGAAELKGTLKGERDPMGILAPRTRWATYW